MDELLRVVDVSADVTARQLGALREFVSKGVDPSPVPIHFRNHASCEEHADVIRKERDVFLRSGAMVRWWDLPRRITKGKPPKVVIPA